MEIDISLTVEVSDRSGIRAFFAKLEQDCINALDARWTKLSIKHSTPDPDDNMIELRAKRLRNINQK